MQFLTFNLELLIVGNIQRNTIYMVGCASKLLMLVCQAELIVKVS